MFGTQRKLDSEGELYDVAVRALMRRAHSVGEMKKLLTRRCLDELLVRVVLARLKENGQLDDARRGVHEHLPPGQGEIDFPAVFRELRRLNYDGPLALELSRDSHRAVDAATDAFKRLSPLLNL